jgi:hypothetical protein
MSFDNRKSIQRTADAESFVAKITESANTVRADISYKPTYKIGVPSITARDMDALMGALQKQDPTVRFYKTGSDAGTLSAKDAAALEAMRTDPRVTDVHYRSAARNFGVKPQVRNLQAATANTFAPQSAPTLSDSVVAWGKFETEHNELFASVFAAANLKAIEQWFSDEPGAQWNAANLATCYAELKALNVFRTANVLTRGMHGDLQVVQPYSRERIIALRNKQVTAQRNAAPAGMSEADTAAWNFVVQNHPGVPVGSPRFRELCSQQVLAWAKESVLESQPELAASDKRGQLSVAINKVIALWTRNPNLNQGNKTVKDNRIWLG